MKIRALAVAAVLLASLPLAAQKRAFTIEDLYRLKSVSDLQISPDSRSIAFVVTSSDLPKQKRTSSIWMMAADGSEQRQLTRGEHDSTPRFSPDGKTLALVRDGNIHLLPLEGGEARQLTKLSTGVSDPKWSPDGKSIAFSSDVHPECGADDACNTQKVERNAGTKLNAHLADELLFRHWNAYRSAMRTHMLLATVETGAVRDLTPGRQDFPPFSLGGPPQYDFSPDGAEIVVVGRAETDGASSTNNELYLLSLTTPDAPRKITQNPAWDGSPRYSPDGRYIAYRMQKQPGFEADLFRLALYDRTNGAHRVLTESYRNWVDDFAWSRDSKTIYFTGPLEGRNPIQRIAVADGAIQKVYDDRTIDAFEIAANGESIVYIGRSVGEPAEIYSARLSQPSTSRRALTTLNKSVMNEVDIRPAEVMWVTGANGAKIQVFVVKPHGFDPSKKYPLILNVHGGPQMQWADAFRGDWQVYPGAGYVVAFPNPHGSTGFGQDFTSAISGDWAGKPFEDVMKITDALEKLPYVDKNRIGAMGWSYGGYLMNWIEGHSDRYEAIVSMMGIFDLRSFYYGTEELWFPEWDLKGQPYNSELYEKFSPSNSVKNFRTPCLVITGEKDFRIPYTQGLQMFTALQKMNVPSRLIVYENAGHWPGWLEMALYYTAHLDWFHSYLGGGKPPWTTEQMLNGEVWDPATGKRR